MMNEEFRMKKLFHPRCLRFLHSSFFILPLLLVSCAAIAAPQTFSGATPLEWSQRLADSEMARQTNAPKLDYTMGLFTLSLLKLNEQVPNARYVKFSEDKVGSLVSPDGTVKGYKPEEFQLDSLNPGKTLLALCQATTNQIPNYFYA